MRKDDIMSNNKVWIFIKLFMLFLWGGVSYLLVELLWRGRTHWTMFIVGGLCFILIGALNDEFTFEMSLIRQMAISAVMITIIEYLAGLLINPDHLIWDYSNVPFNIMGQVCLPYSILWFFLSAIAIFYDDYIRWKWFGEEKPHYVLFSKKKKGKGE